MEEEGDWEKRREKHPRQRGEYEIRSPQFYEEKGRRGE